MWCFSGSDTSWTEDKVTQSSPSLSLLSLFDYIYYILYIIYHCHRYYIWYSHFETLTHPLFLSFFFLFPSSPTLPFVLSSRHAWVIMFRGLDELRPIFPDRPMGPDQFSVTIWVIRFFQRRKCGNEFVVHPLHLSLALVQPMLFGFLPDLVLDFFRNFLHFLKIYPSDQIFPTPEMWK